MVDHRYLKCYLAQEGSRWVGRTVRDVVWLDDVRQQEDSNHEQSETKTSTSLVSDTIDWIATHAIIKRDDTSRGVTHQESKERL